jgi:demethylmenaquinone methyltransferase/2-methoxy-6-polyprenyl-1,4-benzoquinol methylase
MAASISHRESAAIRAMFARIAGRYDFANHLLSAGFDYGWRRQAAARVRAWQPKVIVDLAAGTGDLSLALKRASPEASVVAVDFCEPMLQRARQKGVSLRVAADALQLPFAPGSIDAITVAFGLRNMSSWSRALAEMRGCLRDGGHLLVLDFSVPAPPLRWIYRAYLHHLLPRVAALVTGARGAYAYLGDSIEEFPHGATMCALFEQEGFREVRAEPLTGGIVSLYSGTR